MLDTPVEFTWSQSIAAGATFNPLEDFEHETPSVPCAIEVVERATATGLVSSVKSGGKTIKQEAPVQAGGTAGTTPARLTTEPITGRADAFAKLRVAYRNPTAGAITVDGKLVMTPLAGVRRVVARGRRPFSRRRR